MLRRLLLFALLSAAAVIGSTAPTALAQENIATVHGTIYDLWTFTPMENVVIEVYSDSTLQLRTLVPDGAYSLSLHPGSYTITAKYYNHTILVYDTEENITLRRNDNLTLDLIMFPTFEENEVPENYTIPLEPGEAETKSMLLAWVAGFLLAVAGAVAFYYYMKIYPRKKASEKRVERPFLVKVVGLPDDLKGVMDAIRESGGRINQVKLRKKLPYSEAKVSLMLTDLEDRGLIRKIRKGRGNIIVLTEQ